MNLSDFEEYQETIIDPSMFELFCVEIESQCLALNNGLINLEKNPLDPNLLESLMRAAHSIKGAARVVNLTPIVKLAHAIEDYFVEAQNQKAKVTSDKIDQLLKSVDILSNLAKLPLTEMNRRLRNEVPFIKSLIEKILDFSSGESHLPQSNLKLETAPVEPSKPSFVNLQSLVKEVSKHSENKTMKAFQTTFKGDRVLRVTAQNLNRLMGLAGELLVESRWLYPFGEELQKLKKTHDSLAFAFDSLRGTLHESNLSEITQNCIATLYHAIYESRTLLIDKLSELDNFIRRHANLSDRLYQEVINSRMRPFGDGVEGFPRLVRDLSRQLGKQVRLEIEGKSTPVDRDILEKLETPLTHLLRNAIDHGIEAPEERIKAGKSPEGVIRVEARHRGGMLAISVSDDGRGIDTLLLRKKIIEKKFANEEIVNCLTDGELLDFLYLPGFSTASTVTDISGRGVGLNIVLDVVQSVGGIVRTVSVLGNGMSFNLQLPLTLSVIRALMVKISGETYAFPLARIDQAVTVNPDQIEIIEGRQYFHHQGQNIGLISAWQILELDEPHLSSVKLSVIILSDRINAYGLVVDCLLGEKELVVQELDSRLGKIPDIIAGALMEDGNPILIIDVEDIVRSIDHFLSGGRLTKVDFSHMTSAVPRPKRILLIDDSLTVREIGARLLKKLGYEVETAINGMDGWNAIRVGRYDLIITDVDMPRLNGIELVKMIRKETALTQLPVLIVSYKEGDEFRRMGLEAGANAYLSKCSFHDERLQHAVEQLLSN